jgi:hypothetical protein
MIDQIKEIEIKRGKENGSIRSRVGKRRIGTNRRIEETGRPDGPLAVCRSARRSQG